MKVSEKLVFRTIVVCFLLSGMAGLVYQVTWARYLALFLGHTGYAVVAVLIAFMGGLALGNAWLGARSDFVRKPLAMYAWLELGIAIYAVVFPTYFEACHSVFVRLAGNFQPGGWALLWLKFAFSVVTVLLPSTLMGATFPALTRFVTRSLAELQGKVAALYSINSFGAVLGCLLADFWWIPSFGLEITVFIGAVLNLVAALFALALNKSLGDDLRPALPEPNAAPSAPITPRELRLCILAIGVSGYVAMAYEVAWNRVLALALGATTHAFSLMVATFITGIAVGAFIVKRFSIFAKSLACFAWAEIALGLSTFATMLVHAEVPYWFLKAASVLSREPQAYPVYVILQALICFSVMLIPTICLGLTLPLVSRIATIELARTGRSVGKVFAVNTIGTVLGVVFTGLVILPWLGLAQTFALGVALNLIIGVGLLLRDRLTRAAVCAAPALMACFVLLVGAVLDDNWQHTFSAGLWRMPEPPKTRKDFRNAVENGKILYYRDGAGATVTVTSKLYGTNEVLSLKVNGKTDAASAVDVTTQLLLGHVPLLLHPSAREALVIGLGSGMTTAAVARHPSIERIDVVEIAPEVVQASRVFGDYNDRFWENPKVHITVEDAKSFLQIGHRQYDTIVSEPSNPWMSGVAGVFSREYYENCRARLKSDGLMVQWVQSYETSDEIVDTVLRTFSSVFPFVSIWESSQADLLLVGSARPLRVDLDAMEKRFYEPSVYKDFARMQMMSLPVFLATQAISEENGAFFAPADGPINSDYFPILEFQAARAFFRLGRANRWRSVDERLSCRPTTLLGEYLRTHPLHEAELKDIARFYFDYGFPDAGLIRTMLLGWQREHPDAIIPMELLAQIPAPVSAAELESVRLSSRLNDFLQLAQKDPGPLRQYESFLMSAYRSQKSVFNHPASDNLEKVLRRLLLTDPYNQRVYKCHLAEIAWDKGDDASCGELLSSALDPRPEAGPPNFSDDPQAVTCALARRLQTLLPGGKPDDAWALCSTVKRLGLLRDDPLLSTLYRKADALASHASGGPITP